MNRAVQVKFALDHNLKSGSGALTAGDAAIGKAVMHLTGTYQEQGPDTALNMKATGKSMPVDELGSALPALGIVLPAGTKLEGGGVSLDLAISGPSSSVASNRRTSSSRSLSGSISIELCLARGSPEAVPG